MYLVTANEMREMDRKTMESFGLPGRLLMENAGQGATRILKNHFTDLAQKNIAVLAGSGNNGGDGFVMARYLSQMGVAVTVYLLAHASAAKGDAKENLNLLAPLGIPVIEIHDKSLFEKHKTALRHHDIYIDAILGTGLKSAVRGIFKDTIEFLNNSDKPVFAVDIPSGLDTDTGQPHGTSINAQITATFAFPKIGHVLFPGASYTGILEIVDIGIPPHIAESVAPSQYLLTENRVRKYMQPRPPDAHKGTTGHLLVLSGSPGKTGAAALTAMSAMRSGAGLVTLGIPASLNPILEIQTTEVMTCPLPEDKTGRLSDSSLNRIKDLWEGKKCIAIGPGLGVTNGTKKLVSKIIRECDIPLVIDADGLTCIEGNTTLLKNNNSPTILTPHPGEMARLTGASVTSIQKDRITSARIFAQTFNVHLVLKGARTVVAHPNGNIFVNTTGNSGMASGGMGDVLTGIIAGFVTQGYAPEAATHMGVYLHGAVADTLSKEYGPIGFLATDIIDVLPVAIGKLIP